MKVFIGVLSIAIIYIIYVLASIVWQNKSNIKKESFVVAISSLMLLGITLDFAAKFLIG